MIKKILIGFLIVAVVMCIISIYTMEISARIYRDKLDECNVAFSITRYKLDSITRVKDDSIKFLVEEIRNKGIKLED